MSDANFNLLGNAVDLGVYKYYLQQDGDDWKLVGTGAVDPGPDPVDPPRDLSESAKTVIGLHAADANVFSAETGTLRIGSFDYGLDNGMTAHGNAYGSVQGRIGATIGINHKLENGGVFQPYMRFAVAQEFVDSNKLTINTVGFDNAFDGTRGEVGAGFAYQISDALQVHADIDFSAGKDIDRNWGGNLGLSYRF